MSSTTTSKDWFLFSKTSPFPLSVRMWTSTKSRAWKVSSMPPLFWTSAVAASVSLATYRQTRRIWRAQVNMTIRRGDISRWTDERGPKNTRECRGCGGGGWFWKKENIPCRWRSIENLTLRRIIFKNEYPNFEANVKLLHAISLQ